MQAIGAGEAFKDLGFDSLMAVEFRDHLNRQTGLNLPVSLVFNFSTLRAVADLLLTELMPEPTAQNDSDAHDAEIRSALASISIERLRKQDSWTHCSNWRIPPVPSSTLRPRASAHWTPWTPWTTWTPKPSSTSRSTPPGTTPILEKPMTADPANRIVEALRTSSRRWSGSAPRIARSWRRAASRSPSSA
ncbi:acyl carrier protein [Streptomyces zhihengii]